MIYITAVLIIAGWFICGLLARTLLVHINRWNKREIPLSLRDKWLLVLYGPISLLLALESLLVYFIFRAKKST